ncbi:hypothetical protein CMI41_04805 [Candidatus Pacearchaeota archaeon]|nr:hypothetical protein [Candidatus Pacearchaeota archaeon]
MVEDHSSFKVVPSATNDVDFNSNKIINAGDVGIGTADPDAPLHITATGITGNQDRLVQLEQTTSDEGSIIILAAKDSGGTSQWWNIGPRETHNFGIGYSHDPGNNEFFTIKNDGNVGIGTTSPDELLDVEGGNIRLKSDSEGNTGLLRIYDSTPTESGQIYGASGDLRIYSGADVLFTQVGNVGIGTTSPATSAKLEISSTTGALLMPRMTTAQRNALTAVNGMIIYNSTTNAFNFYENGSWVSGSGLV